MSHYTTKQLADMQLPGLPHTRQGWDARVVAEGWTSKAVYGRGPRGMRREYLPPPEVQALIDAHVAAGKKSAGSDALPSTTARRSTPPGDLSEPARAASRVLEDSGVNFNLALLEAVVRGIETFCERNDLRPTPEKKAVAIALMYRYAVLKGAELGTDDIAAFFKLAA